MLALVGGKARAKELSAKRRKEIPRLAASAGSPGKRTSGAAFSRWDASPFLGTTPLRNGASHLRR